MRARKEKAKCPGSRRDRLHAAEGEERAGLKTGPGPRWQKPRTVIGGVTSSGLPLRRRVAEKTGWRSPRVAGSRARGCVRGPSESGLGHVREDFPVISAEKRRGGGAQVVGRHLVRRLADSRTDARMITETEAYVGERDRACHARAGRTARTEVLYQCRRRLVCLSLLWHPRCSTWWSARPTGRPPC